MATAEDSPRPGWKRRWSAEHGRVSRADCEHVPKLDEASKATKTLDCLTSTSAAAIVRSKQLTERAARSGREQMAKGFAGAARACQTSRTLEHPALVKEHPR